MICIYISFNRIKNKNKKEEVPLVILQVTRGKFNYEDNK